MEEWIIKRKGGDFEKIANRFHISPRIASLIRNKNIIEMSDIQMYLEGSISDLNDPMFLKDIDKALDILTEKIDQGKKIRVIGDYDIDGINATYILLTGIRRLGGNVDSDIPDRMKDGYGINEELIERAYHDGVDTVITCDNGIAAKEAIDYGKNLGMTIIVTDHHEVPYEMEDGERTYILPAADGIVNPKQEDCNYPFKDLCGAGIAYKLIEALCEIRGKDVDEMDDLLENAAIATVGDVMDLVGENRILVKEGLARIRKTKNIGLNALIEATNLTKESIGTYHIGFVLGPVMNASGRLSTAKKALELLEITDKREGKLLAEELKALNDSRKEMTEQGVKKGVESLGESPEAKVLVLYLKDCHESIAGIVAGRIKEAYHHPVIVLTDGKDGLKGSGRSIEAYDMYEGINECKDLLTKYGGHKMAAGLSLPKENLEEFTARINRNARLSPDDFKKVIRIDMELPFSAVSERFIYELSLLEPFGKGNEKPVFALRGVEIIKGDIIGKNQNVLKGIIKDGKGDKIDFISFQNVEELQEKSKGNKMNITYYPQVNEYNGYKTLQIVITNYRIV